MTTRKTTRREEEGGRSIPVDEAGLQTPARHRARPRVSQEGVTHIADLVADPHNRRAHNPRNVGMIVDALQRVGAARSIVIDEHNEVLAGNGVLDAAAEAGITKVHVVDADGSTIVAVRRTGLSDEQKRALAIYDNRTAELAEWDLPQLALDAAADAAPAPEGEAAP